MKQFNYHKDSVYWGNSIELSTLREVKRPALLIDYSDEEDVVILKWGEWEFLSELLSNALNHAGIESWVKDWKVIEVDPEGDTFTKQEIVHVLNFLITHTGFISNLLKAEKTCKDHKEFHNWCIKQGIIKGGTER